MVIIKNGDRRPEDDFTWLSKPVFIDRLKGETFLTSDNKRIEKSKYFLSHPKAEHYHHLDFDPSKPPGPNGKTWNLWEGFAYEPIKGDWSLLHDHILRNVCLGDKELYDWLLNWMALGVQQPSLVIGTAPVLLGQPGTGKGTFANAYGALWGRHYTAITHNEHVAGRFNAHLIAKRFVLIDEGTAGATEGDAGVIKTRITEPIIILEPKGVDPMKIRNRMIFMVASNSLSAVAADPNERRWMVFEVGDAERENHDYFAAIAKQMDDGGFEAMLHELLERDISKGPDAKRILRTEALFGQIMINQPPHVQYLHGLLDEGRLPQNDIIGASTTTIRAVWEDMSRNYRGQRLPAMNAFGRFIRKTFPDVMTKQAQSYRPNFAPHGELELSTEYSFPSLAKCRAAFERYFGTPVPWSKQTTEWRTGQPAKVEEENSIY